MKNLEVSLRDLGIILAFGSSAGGPSIGGPANRTSTNNAVATWNGTAGNSLNDNPDLVWTPGTFQLTLGAAASGHSALLSLNGNPIIQSPSGPLRISVGGNNQMYFTGGQVLIGNTTTNNGNGILQLIAATTIVGGIGFGADAAIYRSAAGVLTTSASWVFPAGTTSLASMTITTGVAPTSPADGNFWYDGTNLKFRNGATTRTVTWV